MKNFLVAVLVSSFSFAAFAEGNQPKHIITIGSDGLGLSSAVTMTKTDKDKIGLKDQDSSISSLKLNYNYIFSNRVMLGAELNYNNEKIEIKYVSGDKETDETTTSTIAVSVGYNFNEDLFNSWWVKGSLGTGSINSETKETGNDPEKTETDYSINFFSIAGGKRFNLDSWGLKNFSYSPSVVVTSATLGDDADDYGIESSTSVQLNVLAFDILF